MHNAQCKPLLYNNAQCLQSSAAQWTLLCFAQFNAMQRPTLYIFVAKQIKDWRALQLQLHYTQYFFTMFCTIQCNATAYISLSQPKYKTEHPSLLIWIQTAAKFLPIDTLLLKAWQWKQIKQGYCTNCTTAWIHEHKSEPLVVQCAFLLCNIHSAICSQYNIYFANAHSAHFSQICVHFETMPFTAKCHLDRSQSLFYYVPSWLDLSVTQAEMSLHFAFTLSQGEPLQ